MRGKPFTTDDDRINRTGRPKGSPNKTSEEIRVMLQDFIDANLETLQADFDLLEPRERLGFIERLLKHILPAPIPGEPEKPQEHGVMYKIALQQLATHNIEPTKRKSKKPIA